MQPVLNFEQASNKLKETEGFFQMELPEFSNRYLQGFDAFIKSALNDYKTA